MGGDELSIDASRIDHGKAGDENSEGKAPDQGVARHLRASHPAVTNLAPSIATAITTRANDPPGNRTTMPLIEKKAAAPARAIAGTYARRYVRGHVDTWLSARCPLP